MGEAHKDFYVLQNCLFEAFEKVRRISLSVFQLPINFV